MAPLVLYHSELSTPSRMVLMVIKALGLDAEIKVLNILGGEQFAPEFLKINPQHCVPTLVDGDFVLWESKAIACYLINEYGKNDKLYPKNNKLRAVVDQRLHFDSCTLFLRIKSCFLPIIMKGEKEIRHENKASLYKGFKILENTLGDNDYMAGKWLTVADFAIISSLTTTAAFGWDFSQFPRISKWAEKCSSEIPDYYEYNEKGAIHFANIVKSKMSSTSKL